MGLVRWVFRLALILAILLIATFFLIPAQTIADYTEATLENSLSREVTLGSDPKLSIFPNIGVQLQNISIANAEWSTSDPLVEAEYLSVVVAIIPLLSGSVEIKSLELGGATVFLHRLKDGRANWNFKIEGVGDGSAENEPDGAQPKIKIDKLNFKDSMVTYLDEGSKPQSISGIFGSIRKNSRNGQTYIDLNFNRNGENVEVSSKVAKLDDFLVGQITDVSLEINSGETIASYNGSFSTNGNAEGRLQLISTNLTKLSFLISGKPSNTIYDDLSFSSEIKSTDFASIQFNNAQIASPFVNGSFVSKIDLSKERPFVSANVVANSIGQAAAVESMDGTSLEERGSQNNWSNNKLDLSILNSFDANISVSAANLLAGPLTFAPASFEVRIDNGRAVTNLKSISGYEGVVSGEFVLNNRNGLSVGGDLVASQISLKPFLSDTVESDKFSGLADFSVSFLGVGNSMNEIMNSLSGKGKLNIGSGTISGVDLDSLFRGQPTGGTTIFDSMTATWMVESGIILNEDLLTQLPNVEAKGQGQIGVGKKDIDYTLTPALKIDGDEVALFPVKVEGPWIGPRVYPDLQAIIEQDIGKQLKAAEDQLKEDVETKVRDELGLSAEENIRSDSIEDKIEEQVKKGLGKLFGLD